MEHKEVMEASENFFWQIQQLLLGMPSFPGACYRGWPRHSYGSLFALESIWIWMEMEILQVAIELAV